jgi:hypothetical protein
MATITPINTFGTNQGGAAFGNPTIARQGQASGATQVSNAGGGRGFVNPANALDPSASPPKASAAQAKTGAVYSSLVDALNQHQQQLVKDGKQEIADQYVIEFAPPDLASQALKQPGVSNSDNTAMQSPNTAASVLNPSSNSINYNSQGWQVTAGQQIVQLIDQVMRSSTYITSQQSQIVDENGQCKANPSSTNSTAWYKISVSATPLGYDHTRRDFAYQLRYVVSPYAINQAASQYFPDSKYRGSHKSYNYWFTGLNTQILNFEQEYNNLYRIVISGIGHQVAQKVTSDFRDQMRRTYLPTSGQQTQGGNPAYVTEPGANLADFLYSPSDQAKCKLHIVGDPAWMQQGEVGPGIGSTTNFSFQPFNADGGINYDSQQIVFDISWNAPADYNLNTGTMDIQNNQYGQPVENVTYTAIKCKSTFSRGRFEQEIEGRALLEFNKNKNIQSDTANGRPQTGSADSFTNIASTTIIGNTVINNLSLNNLSRQVNSLTGLDTPWITSLAKFQNPNPTPNSTSQVAPSNPGTQPAAAPEPPTSNGDINSTNGDTQQDQTSGQNTSGTSQQIAQDD